MANLTEVSNFDANVYQLDFTDPVLGGPGGQSNFQAQALANRTRWLKDTLNTYMTRVFVSQSQGSSQVVGNNGVLNWDGSAYAFAFPLASPDYTTPNDGITRTYKITISGFADFTYNAVGNIRMRAYSTTAGPTLNDLVVYTLRQPFESFMMTKTVTLAPNTRIKVALDNNATGANATFSAMQMIIEEI